MGECILAAASGSFKSMPCFLKTFFFWSFIAWTEGSLVASQFLTCDIHRGRFFSLLLDSANSERGSSLLKEASYSTRERFDVVMEPELLPADAEVVILAAGLD
jgi:hypothetical protein